MEEGTPPAKKALQSVQVVDVEEQLSSEVAPLAPADVDLEEPGSTPSPPPTGAARPTGPAHVARPRR